MKTAPRITVQLIHIEGPLKGQIVELTDPVIEIGRHPSCQVRFPADLNIISRKHATITREGNRFMLSDHSVNGTIVNGHKVHEVYLKDGDVITIAETGPKISFLTRVEEKGLSSAVEEPEGPKVPDNSTSHARPSAQEQSQSPFVSPGPEPKIGPEPGSEPPSGVEPLPGSGPMSPVQKSCDPLIVQYGPTLRSFDLPVKVGRHAGNDLVLEHPGILDLHAKIFFAKGQYWIRDLTGAKLVTVNGVPAGDGVPFRQNDQLGLGPSGPYFQVIGNGRLSEMDMPSAHAGRGEQETGQDRPVGRQAHGNGSKRHSSFLKSIFDKF